MRLVAALVVLLAVVRADAEPVARRPPPVARRPAVAPAADTCTEKRWDAIASCLKRAGQFTIVGDISGAKLVGIGQPNGSVRLMLYMRAQPEELWRIAGPYLLTNATTAELLEFSPYESVQGGAVRLDMGYANPTTVSIDAVSTTRVLLKRKNTTICTTAPWQCRTVTTECDVFVRGKSFWTFRGEPVWDGVALRVRGDVRNAGTHCTPPRSSLVKES